MKRTIAIILLIIGGVLACGLGILGLAAPFVLTSGLNLLCFLSIAVHTVAAVFVQGLYQRRGWLNKWQFWLCAGLPSTMIGGGMLIFVMILDNAGYFHGFFAGLGEFLISFAILVYSGVFFALLGIVLLIKHAVSRKDRIPVILLVIGGALACAIAAALCAALILGALPWLWFLCAVVLAGHIAGAELLQRLYQRRGWLNTLNLWAYSGGSRTYYRDSPEVCRCCPLRSVVFHKRACIRGGGAAHHISCGFPRRLRYLAAGERSRQKG